MQSVLTMAEDKTRQDIKFMFPKESKEQSDSEGNHVLLTKKQLLEEEPAYAWGYDYTISHYFGQDVSHFVDGVQVTNLGHGDGSGNPEQEWTTLKK